jgi:hypothetical protein
MIVRIMGEGQLEIGDEHLDALNALDDDLQVAVDSGDEAAFRAALTALLERVRAVGVPLAADVLTPSELILPAPESSVDEVRALLKADGLIPG